MKISTVELMTYTKREEIFNVATHLLGGILCYFICETCLLQALTTGENLSVASALWYFLGTSVMFFLSVCYHACPPGQTKKTLRVLDHCGVFLAVSGTAAGCVPAVKNPVSGFAAYLMLSFAVLGSVGGLITTLIGFDKTKTLRNVLYISTAAVSAVCGAGAYFRLPIAAFFSFFSGSIFLGIGAFFLRKGKTKKYFHTVFHLFVLLGLTVYYLGISRFCY